MLLAVSGQVKSVCELVLAVIAVRVLVRVGTEGSGKACHGDLLAAVFDVVLVDELGSVQEQSGLVTDQLTMADAEQVDGLAYVPCILCYRMADYTACLDKQHTLQLESQATCIGCPGCQSTLESLQAG